MLFAWCISENPLVGCEALTEWEYLPPVGPRPTKGFVGLKNAGATCYMNSVIQQLYMIPPIRNGILAIEGTGSDVDDDMSGDEKQDNEVPMTLSAFSAHSLSINVHASLHSKYEWCCHFKSSWVFLLKHGMETRILRMLFLHFLYPSL